jgi:2-polyprenyl-3-methyl-5-hydroxy-6-metoxy-1,4-benzoquinol methylase
VIYFKMISTDKFKQAEQLYASGDFEAASVIYTELTSYHAIAPLAYYRLASIANIAREANTAESLYYKAFELNPNLCLSILPEKHPNRGFKFTGKKDEEIQTGCPLCSKTGEAYWCYCIMEMGGAYAQAYNPIRVWIRCGDCHHLYAKEFPKTKNISEDTVLVDSPPMPTRPHFFAAYSGILSRLAQFTPGNRLLEVGVGGSECALVAFEMGFDVFGIDIVAGNIRQAKKYGLSVEIADFVKFKPNRMWDIIIMGDVIEHVSDPMAALKKVRELLADGGVVWISTPNYEAAFAKVAGHNDPMRREPSHKNYFSRNSLFKLLETHGFAPVDYRVSAHYNGSMEVIAVVDAG